MRYRNMANALHLAPLLLVTIAFEPASAEPAKPSLKLQSIDAVRFSEPATFRRDPALRLQLSREDEEMMPGWTLPFVSQEDDRGRRGVTFSVRPGRGLKARAKIRF